MKLDNLYNYFIVFIFIIKILFVICTIWHSYLVKKDLKAGNNNNLKKINTLEYWKERFEFIFIFCMSFICIYIFSPFNKNFIINTETRILMFVFGIIVLINSNWGLFFKQTKWLTELQSDIGK